MIGLIDPKVCEIYTTLVMFPEPAVGLKASDGEGETAILTPARAREVARALLSYANRVEQIAPKNINEDCQFEHPNAHEWYCTIHKTVKIAGTKEPVTCN